jgi:hypothetical protein
MPAWLDPHRLIWCLLLGGALSVAVAVGGSLALPCGGESEGSDGWATRRRMLLATVYEDAVDGRVASGEAHAAHLRSIGFSADAASPLLTGFCEYPPDGSFDLLEAGWPLRSLQAWRLRTPLGPSVFVGSGTGNLPPPKVQKVLPPMRETSSGVWALNVAGAAGKTGPREERWVPLRPMWAGAMVNAAAWGVACWCVLTLGAAVRRGRRGRLGLCPHCRYDLRGLQEGVTCPECGRPTPIRPQRTNPHTIGP